VSRDPNKPPHPGRGLLGRAVAAWLLIALATAGAVSAAVLLQVKDIVTVIKNERAGRVELDIPEVTPSEAGKPQTLMILGTDGRFGDKKLGLKARSDTIVLVRLDAHQKVTAVMNVPRDLLVQIPGYGTTAQKINGAYTLGGPRLTLKTVKAVLSTPERPFKINHVITIDFEAFERAVNYIGGVYVDVDRHYFNDNSQGGERFATIDVPAGYQKLHGQDALDYVRYRHGDNDLVRARRQQDFLRQIRKQLGARKLMDPSPKNLRQLAKLFARYFDYDKHLNDTKQILRLAKLVLGTAKLPVAEVPFEAVDAPDHVNLEASQNMIGRTVDAFLNPKAGPTGGSASKSSGGGSSKSRRSRKSTSFTNVPGLVNARTEGENQAIIAARKAQFPFYFPTLRLNRGTYVGQAPRLYSIRDELGKLHRAYRLVLSAGQNEGYYGVQGTTWRGAPILADPHTFRTVKNRKLSIYKDGSKVRLVAWRTPRGVYWVSNTLQRTLNERQMIAIAASLRHLHSH
jgi:polyisoprenyl-teichoic acid--peptidoglycan teichoic acid transferase